MSLEQKINYQLNKYPKVKKVIKSGYQHAMYAFSPKIKSEGNIIRISPDDNTHEYFFGYYDKSPWDASDRYMLCMRAKDTWSDVSPKEPADIILIDTELNDDDTERVKKIADTRTWNVQQGCMLQWLGPDYSSKIIYNDFRDNKYISVILNIHTCEETIIDAPIYTVSSDGKTALTLDFSRLYNLRPGYGYYNLPEVTKGIALPNATAIWKIDLETNHISELLSYRDFASFYPREEMRKEDVVHKVNHLMLSPSGNRFMVLYRWFMGDKKYTRLITCNIDGTDMYLLSDEDMVSHCFWKDDEHILAFENKKEGGPGYYFMKDKTQEYIHCWAQLSNDGHPSYSPDRRLIVTDTYPDRARMAEIKLMDGADETKNNVKVIARTFAPFRYDNDTRCDLHPRWNHKGDQICFDSIFEGSRGLYTVSVPTMIKPIQNEYPVSQDTKVTCVIPSYKRCDTVTRAIDSVLAQTYKNIEVCLVDDNVPGDEYSQKLQEVLKKYEGDSRVRYIKQDNHINGAAARNIGIKFASGDFIGFLDDDDEWLPEKIERQMKILQADPSLDAVTVLWTINERGKEIRRCSSYTSDNLQFKVLLREVAIYTSTVLIKKSAIEQFGGFDEQLFRHQDLQFFVRALEKSKFEVLPEYLVKLHVDSEINRPDSDGLIKAKQAFYKSVQDQIEQYSLHEQRRIVNAHYYEIVFHAIKNHDYDIAFQYLFKVKLTLHSIKDLLKRYYQRL